MIFSILNYHCSNICRDIIIQKMQKQITKQQKEWNKQLTYHLDKYTQIREWSDLANWLVKLKQILSDCKFNIIDKENLLKKLASCLNPSLPIALHELAIECYDILMKSDLDVEILPLLSVGLFPFFQSATTRTKQKILQLFTKHLTKVNKQLYPLTTGFIISILPGLLEMHQPLQKDIINAIDQFAILIGEETVISSVWTAMLRANYCRLAGFKYLTAKLALSGEGIQDQQEMEEDQQQYWGVNNACNAISLNGSPTKQEKPSNELNNELVKFKVVEIQNKESASGQKKSEKLIKDSKDQRNINYMPFKDTLVVNTIIACLEDSNTLVIKGALDFLYKYLSLRNQSLNYQEKGLLIDNVILLLSKRDMSMTRKINLWLFGVPDEDNKYNITEKNASVLPLIIQSFERHLNNPNYLEQGIPLKILASFYIEHQHLIKDTLKSLAKSLISFIYKIRNIEKNETEQSHVKRLMPYIIPHKSTILQSLGLLINQIPQHVEEENQQLVSSPTNSSTKSIEILNIIQFFIERLLKDQEKQQILLETIILMINSLKKYMHIKIYLNEALQLINTILQMYESEYLKKPSEQKSVMKVMKVSQITNIKRELITYEKRDKFQNSITEFANFYICVCDLAKKSKSESFQNEFENITTLIINFHKFKHFQEHNPTQIQWCLAMCSMIRHDNIKYYLPAIEGVVTLLELVNINQTNYSDLKTLIIDDNKKNFNFIELALEKLWALLTYHNLHEKVIPSILKLSKYFPDVLTFVVSNSFESNNYSQKELSIAKFSVFWKESGKRKEILSSKELNQLNKVGLFLMLDFLENPNPLVRYTTKLWITQSLPEFYRILDPLLQILLQPANLWYKTYQGQYIYTKHFQFKRTIQIMKKLKVLIHHVREKFVSYLLKPISDHIRIKYDHFSIEKKQCNYLELLINILLKYLQCKFVLVKDPDCTVDLIACELLDSLISVTQDSQLCYLMIKISLQEILLCLHFAIVNQELVIQIQLLNLLKSILFNSSLLKQNPNDIKNEGKNQVRNDIKKFFRSFIGSKYFIGNLLSGLDNQSSYIKERYVQFIGLSIPYFLEYHNNSSELISYILKMYTTKLNRINEKRNKGATNEQLFDLNIFKKNTEILIILGGIKDLFIYFFDLKIKMFEKQKTQTETDFGQFSLYSWNSYVFLELNQYYENKSRKIEKNEETINKIAKKLLEELYQTVKVIIDCWTLTSLKDLYKFSRKGIASFQIEKFRHFNNSLSKVINKFENGSIENYIIHLLRVLFNKYPQDLLNCMVLSWVATNNQEVKTKIIEILITMSIPVQRFYEVIYDTAAGQKIRKIQRKRKASVTIQKNGQNEVILFCHAFSYYSYQHLKMNQIQYLTNIWNPLIKFMKLFLNSKNAITIFLLIELFDFFIVKHNPKELLKDQKIRKELLTIVNELQTLVNIASGKYKIQFGQGFKFTFEDFMPLPTSVYQIHLKENMKIQEAKMSCFFFNIISIDKAIQYIKLYAFMILKRIGYNVIQNINDSDITLLKKVRQIFSVIFPVIEDKKAGNMIFAQKSSELICEFLEKNSIYYKEFKNDILQIFNKDDFFICTRKTLQYWAKIMDKVIDSNKDIDIFIEYLSKVSLASSIFTKESIQTKKKIKSFERICFILYSGTKDKYSSKLVYLVQKIVDVIKGNDAPPPVLILILFCIRILILRTSNQTLTKLFIDLWQMILFLLMNIFNKEVEKKAANMNLIWAALKLIQMISLTQTSEFYTHQWIFFYDFVGVKLVSKDQVNELEYKYKPLVKKYLPDNITPMMTKVINKIQGTDSLKRHIIIKQDKIDDFELLRAKALALSEYLIQNNSHKYKIDIKEVQQLIEGDFLTLDEFIYKVQ